MRFQCLHLFYNTEFILQFYIKQEKKTCTQEKKLRNKALSLIGYWLETNFFILWWHNVTINIQRNNKCFCLLENHFPLFLDYLCSTILKYRLIFWLYPYFHFLVLIMTLPTFFLSKICWKASLTCKNNVNYECLICRHWSQLVEIFYK